MNKGTITLINPNLATICLEAQELILQGYTFAESYPMLLGWQYHAILERIIEKEVVEIERNKPGRPKTNK